MRPIERVAAALILLGACGGARGGAASSEAPLPVPARAVTAGDGLLALAPAGADVVVELDVARLRDNPAIGPLIATLAGGPLAGPLTGLDFDLVSDADAVVVCAYEVGVEPASLTLVRGPRIAALAGATRLDERTAALGPPALLARLEEVRLGTAPALAGDRELLRLRAAAMPAAAEGASVRVAARLGFDARVRLASLLALDHVPATVSVWGDVVDDLAVIALLGGGDPGEASALVAAAVAWRDQVAGDARVRLAGLTPVVRGVVVEPSGGTARLLLHVGPRRLAALVARFLRLSPSKEPGS